ncbi:hypothetical protein K2F43_05420 [Clostridium estertheticum]|uniref:hypothetical protein n=1 Tax=Clostridium estertheticum TaxID=238834 RepID=UPI001C6E88BB|nr:hypothetical protein [Clostridium estertheticum]MBW9170643.1 hypothetical protein [Clostridium estertheticum]WLC74510.1 hypothetical protein KTC99_17330 [Clostridium estertheticum]
MDEKEELKQEMQQQLEWVQYRQKMLDIIEEKLLQMREIVEQAKEKNLIPEEIEILNAKLNNLAAQVNALDSESRITEDCKIIE